MDAAGARSTANTNDPAIAKTTEKASGRNVLPSTPSNVKIGTNTITTIRIAKTSGCKTSAHAPAIRARLSSPSFEAVRIRFAFSTITTAPSTIIPIAIAIPPSDIRLADTPKSCIASKAKPTENGIEATTIRLGRHPRRKRNNMMATSSAPCHKAVVMVPTAAPTNSD